MSGCADARLTVTWSDKNLLPVYTMMINYYTYNEIDHINTPQREVRHTVQIFIFDTFEVKVCFMLNKNAVSYDINKSRHGS